jgi:PPM family protein phosphatase
MVSDDEMAAVLRQASTLEEAADALVRAANQSGGKDNITVVLFRLGEDEAPAEEEGENPSASETMVGAVTAEEVREAAPPQPAPPAPEAPPAPPPAPRPRRRPGARTLLRGVVTLAAVGAVVFGLYALSRQVWFVGTNDAGLVTLYRGVPYDLPFGIHLYQGRYQSGVPARAIPASRRSRVLDHQWRSRQDAQDLVRQLERGRLEQELGR